jgi:hypothetical protein
VEAAPDDSGLAEGDELPPHDTAQNAATTAASPKNLFMNPWIIAAEFVPAEILSRHHVRAKKTAKSLEI